MIYDHVYPFKVIYYGEFVQYALLPLMSIHPRIKSEALAFYFREKTLRIHISALREWLLTAPYQALSALNNIQITEFFYDHSFTVFPDNFGIEGAEDDTQAMSLLARTADKYQRLKHLRIEMRRAPLARFEQHDWIADLFAFKNLQSLTVKWVNSGCTGQFCLAPVNLKEAKQHVDRMRKGTPHQPMWIIHLELDEKEQLFLLTDGLGRNRVGTLPSLLRSRFG